MYLNTLKDNKGASKTRMRVGRGIGSGKGKTAGRGTKGYKARSGSSVKAFEGGQMPLYMRLPKRGFKNIFRVAYEPLNTGYIQKAIDEKKLEVEGVITKKILVDLGLIRHLDSRIKLLAKGHLGHKIQIEVDAVSGAALEMVKSAGGSVIILEKAS